MVLKPQSTTNLNAFRASVTSTTSCLLWQQAS